jgi:hypothetical protein
MPGRAGRNKNKSQEGIKHPEPQGTLIAYSETTAENVIRPCIVKTEGQKPYLQWFGFDRCAEEDLLRVYAYDIIHAKVPDLLQEDDRPKGIPFAWNVADDEFGLPNGFFSSIDHRQYSPYVLIPKKLTIENTHILRLMSSEILWNRVAARVSLWAMQNTHNGLETLEMFHSLREAFRRKTSSLKSVEIKLLSVLGGAIQLLSSGRLLTKIIEEILDMDEDDGNQNFLPPIAVALLQSGILTRDLWVQSCRKLDMDEYIGAETEGDDEDANRSFRWAYEDQLGEFDVEEESDVGSETENEEEWKNKSIVEPSVVDRADEFFGFGHDQWVQGQLDKEGCSQLRVCDTESCTF